jgi:hypothetical protein
MEIDFLDLAGRRDKVCPKQADTPKPDYVIGREMSQPKALRQLGKGFRVEEPTPPEIKSARGVGADSPKHRLLHEISGPATSPLRIRA